MRFNRSVGERQIIPQSYCSHRKVCDTVFLTAGELRLPGDGREAKSADCVVFFSSCPVGSERQRANVGKRGKKSCE